VRPLSRELRALLWLFAALALIAGVLLFGLSEDTDRFFSWTIEPPLTAAFLGASYWAACVLIAWAAHQRLWTMARATMAPVLVIAVLLLIATLIYLDRFHMDSVFGWFWLIVYLIVPPALVILLVRQLRAPGSDSVRGRRLPSTLRVVLVLQAATMLAAGIALFAAPAHADALWPWQLTPLTARAVGAFLIGFGVAAAHAAVESDLARFEGPALAYTALGVLQLAALALHSGDLTGASIDTWVYVGFLASVILVGAYASALARSSSTDSSAIVKSS
jgi:hypothetical protein